MNYIKIILSLLLIVLFQTKEVLAVSEPKYKVESKTERYEIRTYPITLVAQTKLETEFEKAGNNAFVILADSIFGNNKSKTKIDMTAPVLQQSASQQPVSQQAVSEKIAMTAPVSQIKNLGGYVVQFTMPEEYTIDTLPIPNDKRVELIQVPARTVAVYSYSGSWSESKYNKKLEEFKLILTQDNIKTQGEPIFARFDSPFRLWFLRRNEIWLEVTQ